MEKGICRVESRLHTKRKMVSQITGHLLKSAVNTLNEFICSYENAMGSKIFVLGYKLFLCCGMRD